MEKANLRNVSGAVLVHAAKEMHKRKLGPAEIGRRLNVSTAAASQYLCGTRGGAWTLSKDARERVGLLVEAHLKDNPQYSISALLAQAVAIEVGRSAARGSRMFSPTGMKCPLCGKPMEMRKLYERRGPNVVELERMMHRHVSPTGKIVYNERCTIW